MAVSNDLFELIQSLSRSEKRYFRMTASSNSRSKVNKYMHLFDLIDAQGEYDEDRVRGIFAAKFNDKYFSEAKYYLYNAILRSLHSFATDRSIDVQLSIALHQARILFDKKLFRQCEKLVARIKKQAVEHERWYLAVEAGRFEFGLRLHEGADAAEKVEELLTEVARNTGLMGDMIEHWDTYARMEFQQFMIGPPRTTEQLEGYRNLLRAGIERHGSHAATPMGKLYDLISIAICRNAEGDIAGALTAYRSMLPVMEQQSALDRPYSQRLVYVLIVVCAYSILTLDSDCFFEHYPKLIPHTEKSPESRNYVLYLQALMLLPSMYCNMGDFHKALETSAPVEQALAEYRDFAVALEIHRTTLYVGMYFGLGDYSRCIDYLNIMLDLKPQGLPEYRYKQARIIQLIVHFERGDDDLMEYLLRSAYRYFITNGEGYKVETVIVAFFRKALRSGFLNNRVELFRELLDELTPLYRDGMERIFHDTVDLVYWLESKVTERSYAEIAREKYERKG